MPAADRSPARRSSPRLAGAVAVALAVELIAAAGALAGPWALATAAPVRIAVAAVTRPAEEPVAAAGPVLLSAPALWDGAVEAVPLSTDARGELDVPASEAALGWWAAGPRPGEAGAAVVVGHVDLRGRAGVFARLAQARPGTAVVVGGARPVRYRVTQVDRYDKDAFPADEVYRPTADAELRLITCGGRFDPRTGHYEDNVVVRAVRV